ncbi:MAG: DUF4960 domain-containing protein, partial [Muribaculaceae bacterium]|nr:DUF4960 domain-containing protein [Muribaculaceae bacterium]
MIKIFRFLSLILITLSSAFAGRADLIRYRNMAMYIPVERIEDMQAPQEKAAAQLFKREFIDSGEGGFFITPKTIDKIDIDQIDCLWINIDSIGQVRDHRSRDAYDSDIFKNKVKAFYQAGGNLYLSKFAVDLLSSNGLGIIPDYMRANIFSAEEGAMNKDIWSINPEIGRLAYHNSDIDGQYWNRSTHPIYAGLQTMQSNKWAAPENHNTEYDNWIYDVFPMQGNSNHNEIHREDHNCMWRLAAKAEDNAQVGLYIGYEGIHSWEDLEINQQKADDDPYKVKGQELAALKYLLDPNGYYKKERPTVNIEIVCPGDIERIDPNNFDCLWIHIDRVGLEAGWQNLPEAFRRADLIEAIQNYMRLGGDVLLTKFATQLVVPIGRVPGDLYTPTVFGSGEGGDGNDNWEVNALIGWYFRDSDPSCYFNRTKHDIYQGLTVRDRDGHSVFPLLGTDNPDNMWREDHNCCWDLNHIYNGIEGNRTLLFQEDMKARVLGTWGHVVDDAVAGIVEFRPTTEFRGRILANGLSAYELAPRNGGNAFTENTNRLTLNMIRYLATCSDITYVSDGTDNVDCFQQDANARVLGTWGQDWNHQAAGLVEFMPRGKNGAPARRAPDSSSTLAELNKDKAPAGTIIANGLGCVQLYHADNNNDYQDNVNKLTTNIVNYLSPYHEKITSGVEAVSAETTGLIRCKDGVIEWHNYDQPVLL